jgi:lysophospholipase L1-like esterase
MPYSPNVWYRIAIWTEGAWATASNYNVSVITFGGRTNVFTHLPMPDGVAEHSKPFGLEFHSGALGSNPPDTPHGAWAIENVLVMIGKGTGLPGGKTDLKTASVAIPTLGQLFARVLALVGPAPADAPKELELNPGDTIVAIGDSITQAGGYLRDIDTILAAHYPDLKIPPIINAGVSGNKSEDLIRRFDADVMAHKPSIITISIGINDVWHRLAQPHDEQVLKGYKANVTKMVEEAQAAGIKVILLAPTIIQEDPQSEGNQRLTMYVEAEKQIAGAEHCQFVDLHSMFLNALNGMPHTATGNRLTQDGVHMNSLGDAIMAAGVLRALGVPDAAITGN